MTDDLHFACLTIHEDRSVDVSVPGLDPNKWKPSKPAIKTVTQICAPLSVGSRLLTLRCNYKDGYVSPSRIKVLEESAQVRLGNMLQRRFATIYPSGHASYIIRDTHNGALAIIPEGDQVDFMKPYQLGGPENLPVYYTLNENAYVKDIRMAFEPKFTFQKGVLQQAQPHGAWSVHFDVRGFAQAVPVCCLTMDRFVQRYKNPVRGEEVYFHLIANTGNKHWAIGLRRPKSPDKAKADSIKIGGQLIRPVGKSLELLLRIQVAIGSNPQAPIEVLNWDVPFPFFLQSQPNNDGNKRVGQYCFVTLDAGHGVGDVTASDPPQQPALGASV